MKIFRGLALIVFIFLAACSGQKQVTNVNPSAVPATEVVLDPTETTAPTKASVPAAECTSPALTVPMTEGPYFTANSPERASLLEPGMKGIQLVLTGSVLTTNCQPIAHALLDFWQADADGQYDNNGYTLRGHQFSDEAGRYSLTTVIPGLYPGRTEHIHVKVQAPGGPVLTTQLFFPNVTQNDEDGIFDATLLITMQQNNPTKATATFNFVIKP